MLIFDKSIWRKTAIIIVECIEILILFRKFLRILDIFTNVQINIHQMNSLAFL